MKKTILLCLGLIAAGVVVVFLLVKTPSAPASDSAPITRPPILSDAARPQRGPAQRRSDAGSLAVDETAATEEASRPLALEPIAATPPPDPGSTRQRSSRPRRALTGKELLASPTPYDPFEGLGLTDAERESAKKILDDGREARRRIALERLGGESTSEAISRLTHDEKLTLTRELREAGRQEEEALRSLLGQERYEKYLDLHGRSLSSTDESSDGRSVR